MPLKFDIPHFIKVDIGRSSRSDENDRELGTLRTSSLSGADVITEEHKFLPSLGLPVIHSTFLVSSLKIASALNTIEYTLELVASKQFYAGTTSFVNGGVTNIVSDTSIHLAANAETQALRHYAVSGGSPRSLEDLPSNW
jgi:hypothetical protein